MSDAWRLCPLSRDKRFQRSWLAKSRRTHGSLPASPVQLLALTRPATVLGEKVPAVRTPHSRPSLPERDRAELVRQIHQRQTIWLCISIPKSGAAIEYDPPSLAQK